MLQKSINLSFFFLCLSLSGQHRAMRYTPINLPEYDDHLIHYGVVLGFNYGTYSTKPSAYFYEHSSSLKRLEPVGTVGFTVGGVINLRLHDQFDFRITPQYGFYQRGVAYTIVDPMVQETVKEVQSIEASFVELPFLVKYKSIRRGNFRMYIIGGVKPSISLSNKNKDQRPDQLRLNSYDFAIDYGLGCDIYFPLFKLAPEIRFSNGLLDMKAPDQNMYARSVQNLKSQTVIFILNFE